MLQLFAEVCVGDVGGGVEGGGAFGVGGVEATAEIVELFEGLGGGLCVAVADDVVEDGDLCSRGGHVVASGALEGFGVELLDGLGGGEGEFECGSVCGSVGGVVDFGVRGECIDPGDGSAAVAVCDHRGDGPDIEAAGEGGEPAEVA